MQLSNICSYVPGFQYIASYAYYVHLCKYVAYYMCTYVGNLDNNPLRSSITYVWGKYMFLAVNHYKGVMSVWQIKLNHTSIHNYSYVYSYGVELKVCSSSWSCSTIHKSFLCLKDVTIISLNSIVNYICNCNIMIDKIKF